LQKAALFITSLLMDTTTALNKKIHFNFTDKNTIVQQLLHKQQPGSLAAKQNYLNF